MFRCSVVQSAEAIALEILAEGIPEKAMFT